jgi:hypothetical protein
MTALPLTGSCNCGAVHFEVSEPPLGAAYCHCTHCQHRTGTGSSMSALIPIGTLKVTDGESVVKSWKPEVGAEKCFCGECGSHLWAKFDGDPPTYTIRMGAFDRDPGVRPLFHQFVRSAPAWDSIPDDGLPRFEEKPPAQELTPSAAATQ